MIALTCALALARPPHPADVPAVEALGSGPLGPLAVQHHDGADDRTLVVLLPGIFADHHALEHRGVIGALRAGGLEADVVAVNAHVGYYARREVADRLVDEVLAPARTRYERVWLMGISLGGLGGLLAARDAPDLVDGVVLLSPWLGRPSAVEPVRAAGGVQRWTPSHAEVWEHELWAWLQSEHAGGWPSAELWLGYADRDLAVDNHHVLADALGEERVLRVSGGHSWRSWRWLAERMASRINGPAASP